MAEALGNLFSNSWYMPHGHCYLWQPSLVWTHVISDSLIGLAYVSIALSLYVLVRRVRLPFTAMFWAFGAFIGFCGATHLMEVLNVWQAEYWVAAIVKVVTACASVATALLLYPVSPKVVAIARAAELSDERRIQLESAHEELKSLYEQIRKHDEAKTRFFANVSHELRTPLSLILGTAEALQRESPGNSARADLIRRNAQVLLKQVNELLDVAKLDAGKLDLQRSVFDLGALVRRTLGLFEPLAQERSLTVVIDAGPELGLEADADKLERVLLNLFSNAFRFTPPGGTVRCSMHRDERTLVIEVADSGPGIIPELRATVFERFVQGEAALTRTFGGTGLGLAIVQEFVKLHGGSVRVDDAPEGGALFRIELPCSSSPPLQVQSSAPPATEAGERTLTQLQLELSSQRQGDLPDPSPDAPCVLVAEDNADMAVFLAESLAPECAVEIAANGAEALARAEALQPQLIITDLMMPKLSGAELVRAVRRHATLKDVPVIILTAKADDDMKIELLRDGASDYLQKPALREEVRARAANLLQSKRARDVLRRELSVRSGDADALAKELVSRKHELEAALEAARLARARAERAAETKSMFLSLVSHELLTPLQTTGMNLELVLRDRESLGPVLRGRLERAERASKRLLGLIDSMLQFIRIERGALEVRRERVDFSNLASEVLEELRPQAQSKLLDMRLGQVSKLAPVYTDPRLVRLVLLNLLANAIKFTDHGHVELSLSADNRGFRLVVGDTGRGISESALEHLFEPFQYSEDLHAKHVAGLGLGLTVVREVVTALGGEVHVQSQVGQGSRFEVWFPTTDTLPAGHGGLFSRGGL